MQIQPMDIFQQQPEFRKTGTTIVGIKYKTGVALFTDTRSTMDDTVEDKNCTKLHPISPSIFCAGAGTAADTDRVTSMVARKLNLFSKKYDRPPSIKTAERIITDYLHSYQGQIGAALILAGKHIDYHLYSIQPYGYSQESNFATLGSGSLAATSVLEAEFFCDMTEEQAIELGIKAVRSGIMNDLYSGSNVDYLIISDTVRMVRNAAVVQKRAEFVPIELSRVVEVLEEVVIDLE